MQDFLLTTLINQWNLAALKSAPPSLSLEGGREGGREGGEDFPSSYCHHSPRDFTNWVRAVKNLNLVGYIYYSCPVKLGKWVELLTQFWHNFKLNTDHYVHFYFLYVRWLKMKSNSKWFSILVLCKNKGRVKP